MVLGHHNTPADGTHPRVLVRAQSVYEFVLFFRGFFGFLPKSVAGLLAGKSHPPARERAYLIPG